MAWNAPKIVAMLKSMPASKAWHPSTAPRMVNTSPRQLASMEKSGVK